MTRQELIERCYETLLVTQYFLRSYNSCSVAILTPQGGVILGELSNSKKELFQLSKGS